MEYDNDRKVKRPYSIVVWYWVLLALINPLVTWCTVFRHDPAMWPVVLVATLLLLPAYMFYSMILAPAYLLRKSVYFALLSILFLNIVVILEFAIYSVVMQFQLTTYEHDYFTFNFNSVARESTWAILYMAISIAIFFIKKGLDEKDLLTNLQKDNNSYYLRYLRSQLNPHFLFNTLNSVYSLSLQKSDLAPDAIIKLSDLMRYLIYECNEDKVPLEKEIAFIRNYIEIEKMRFKADVQFTVEGDTSNRMIEPLLFISFIENGFKHATDNSHTEPFVYITIRIEESQVVLNVINNTSSDLETQAKRIHGKGISNNKSLLEKLYPASYALDIIQTEKEDRAKSNVRLKNARERLETLYPDSHALDVILSNNAFTVSLIVNTAKIDKVHHS